MSFRFDLARRAFEHTGAYDTAIASTLAEVTVDGNVFSRATDSAESKPDDPSCCFHIAEPSLVAYRASQASVLPALGPANAPDAARAFIAPVEESLRWHPDLSRLASLLHPSFPTSKLSSRK